MIFSRGFMGEQQFNSCTPCVYPSQIQVPVPVQIARRDVDDMHVEGKFPVWKKRRRDRRVGLEPPYTVTEEEGDVVAVEISYDQVNETVLVEVSRGHRLRSFTRFERLRLREPSVLLSKDDRYGIAEGVGYGEIQDAVLVEVGHHQVGRPSRRRAPANSP